MQEIENTASQVATDIGTEKVLEKKSNKQSFRELVRFASIAVIIVILIRLFIAEPFVVSGASMVPTFENGDYLIVDKVSYILRDPKRNDIIIFRYPNDPQNSLERGFIKRFFDPGKYFIKRVIGLPSEIVDIKGNEITIKNAVHKDGFVLSEPFVKNIANNNTHFELKDDEYFVMGDNRGASSDSRYWGAVKKEFISGKAFIRLLPIKNMEILPGDYKQIE